MYLSKVSVFIFFIFIFNGFSDTNIYTNKSNYIDETHNILSEKIIKYSKVIDTSLSNLYNNPSLLYDKNRSVDVFFKSKKFTAETKNTFVNLRFNTNLQSKESTKYNYRISARIPLSETKKNLKLFIDNTDEDRENVISNNKNPTPEIGINYFSSINDKIKSKYSLGIHGFNPFVRARYYTCFKKGIWDIEPTQTFRYSIKDKFEEKTAIYFDTKFQNSTMFRTIIDRETKSKNDGMDYSLAFQYFWSIKKNTGLSLWQSFSGNTKYKDKTDTSNTLNQTQVYKGINNYTTSLNWRKSILRKWFFYELKPGVNFHKMYNYKANYTLQFTLDFYIGHLN